MAKKSFDSINTGKQETGINAGVVFDNIEQGKATGRTQPTANTAEQAQRMKYMKTQGRKGCKAIRINLAFTPENHEFIRVMSQVTGQSMTNFINSCIQKYREDNPEIYADAKAVIAKVSGTGINTGLEGTESTGSTEKEE